MKNHFNTVIIIYMSIFNISFPVNLQPADKSSKPSNMKSDFTSTAKDSSPKETIAYICGLRARIECEHRGEHSTRSDRVTNIGYALFCGAVFGCWSEIAYWRGWKFFITTSSLIKC